MDRVSYALGMSVANNIKASGVKNLKVADFAAAMEDIFAGKRCRMEAHEAQELLNGFFRELQQSQIREMKEEGEKFLAENGRKEGVVTLPSGLQYKVIAEGTGRKPGLKDKVRCHYCGTFVDGTKFDSSYDRGEAAVFGVNQVIAGWTEALQLMPAGSKWELYIPYNLGYGEHGAPGSISPYSALVFTVELLEVL